MSSVKNRPLISFWYRHQCWHTNHILLVQWGSAVWDLNQFQECGHLLICVLSFEDETIQSWLLSVWHLKFLLDSWMMWYHLLTFLFGWGLMYITGQKLNDMKSAWFAELNQSCYEWHIVKGICYGTSKQSFVTVSKYKYAHGKQVVGGWHQDFRDA